MGVPGPCKTGGKFQRRVARVHKLQGVLMYKAVLYKSITTAWTRIIGIQILSARVAFMADGTIGSDDAQHLDIDERQGRQRERY